MKRYYFVTIIVLSLSVLLLGLSYSKEAGTNDNSLLIQQVNDNYRIVYSKDIVNTLDDNSVDISLVNKKNSNVSYALLLTEIDNKIVKDVTYSFNNGEEKEVKTNFIKIGNLKKFGTNGDYFGGTLTLKANNDYSFKLKIVEIDETTLYDFVRLSEQVYTDNSGNNRFYGEEVNNYITYNNQLMRIVGSFGGTIKLISTEAGYINYDKGVKEYLNVNDYIASFNDGNVNIENSNLYVSWLTKDNYWLSGSQDDLVYYAFEGVKLGNRNLKKKARYIYELDGSTKIINGEGTLRNPLEVSYGN